MKKTTMALLGLTMTLSSNVMAQQKPTTLPLQSGWYGMVGLGVTAQQSKVQVTKTIGALGSIDLPFSGSAMAGTAGLQVGYMAAIGKHKWLDFHANYEQFLGGR